MIVPYICFNGKCTDAIAFYEKVFQTKASSVMKYSDAPPESCLQFCDSEKNLIMHSSVDILGSTVFMCDSTDDVNYGNGITLQIILNDYGKAAAVFKLLQENGIVIADLHEEFYAKAYGAVCDKFGVNWAIICE